MKKITLRFLAAFLVLDAIFILFIALNSHAYSKKRSTIDSQTVSTPTTPKPSPSPEVIPSPDPGGEKRYTLKCQSCTSAEKIRIAKVEDLLKTFIESKCFEDSWRSFKRIEQTNGLDADAIIWKVRLSEVKDIPIVFYWPTWKQSKNVIGYTYPGQPEIYLNRTFREDNTWTVWSELSNEFHEILHKLGFDHDFKATERRPFSVPYRGNRVVELCEGKI